MRDALLIFLGGGSGSLARYGMGKLLGTSASGLPIATLSSNLVACLIAGFLGSWLAGRTDEPVVKNLFIVGFCGGFSTFSAFSVETMTLFQQGKTITAVVYILLSFVLTLGGAFMGYYGYRYLAR